jgi:ribosomal protein S6--L-glutamate ligase
MKIAILSRNSRLYSTHRLVEAARARHHTVRVLDPLRCYMRIDAGRFEMHYKGKDLQRADAVIPRIGASVTRYGTAVLRQFEMMGVFTPNKSDAVLRARDKLRCLQLLAQQGLGLPSTVFGDNPDDTTDLLAMLGKPPHVIKLVEGAQGQGVVLAEKISGSRSVIEAFRGLYANFLVQEFIAEAKGADVRCFVVGGKVIAAMRRQAKSGEFRSNLHRGGSAEATRLTPAENDAAIRAAAVMGLGIAGVDLLRSKRGPLVLEVNSSPGLEGIESATGVDVAGEIIAYLERRVRQSETRAERRAAAKAAEARANGDESKRKPAPRKAATAKVKKRRALSA